MCTLGVTDCSKITSEHHFGFVRMGFIGRTGILERINEQNIKISLTLFKM